MSKGTFNEWFKEKALRSNTIQFQKYYVEKAWTHQQKKIDELKNEVANLDFAVDGLDHEIIELEQKTSDLQISLTSSLEYCNIKDKKILELEEMVSNLQKSLTSNLQDQYEDYKSEEE